MIVFGVANLFSIKDLVTKSKQSSNTIILAPSGRVIVL